MTHANQSRIFMLPPKQHAVGFCAVCGAAGILQFRDSSTGFSIGSCCLDSLIKAESFLNASAGIRPPTIEESGREHD